MANSYKPKIFLSSTYVDLIEVRAEIVRWLSGIFGAELIIMETFGSDAVPPDINSVRRVRECNLFIGIYAHRYGSIDQDSGKSITELELDESRRAFSSGVLKDILLYVIDTDTNWLIEHGETSKIAQTGLERLKEKSKQHTCTPFKNKDELLFSIVRDIYRRLSEYFGLMPIKVRPFELPAQKSLRKPVGMEFLTSDHGGYLFGRQQNTEQLIKQLEDDKIILLLGDSGVGKTSLIHAGLIPHVIQSGFRPIYTRPFGLACADIVRQIQTSVFEGRTTYRGPLIPLLAEVTGAIGDEKLLLIIDQFEDVLTAQDNRETELLISELRAFRELAAPSLSILISYRADLEGRLGEYWQKISGSPQGLPRIYIGGIDKDAAWNGVKQVATDLSVTIDLRDIEQKRIKEDLFGASRPFGIIGVYPPYIQMLIDHIWASSEQGKTKYNIKKYQESGGMEGVIGGYLSRLMEYAQDTKGHVRAVLVALMRSYGVKAQRSMDEIVADTGLDRRDCEIALETLIDLRLVRPIDTSYEVSHDFIARKIMAELVDSEEREFKRFRELLTTKAAAYQTTEAPLSSEELLMLYKHRNRIVPNEMEFRLLLSSWLEEAGPALYWLLNAPSLTILNWLRAGESEEELSIDKKASIILLRRKLGETALVSDDFSVFRGYQLSAEMSSLILEEPLIVSKKLLTYGLRHRRAEVREASTYAVALQIKKGDLEWIERLRKSSSARCQQTYYELILREDVKITEDVCQKSKALKEFKLLKKMLSASSRSEIQTLYNEFKKTRPPHGSLLFGKALYYIRKKRINQLFYEVSRVSKEKAAVLLAGVDKQISEKDFEALITEYVLWNSQERGRYDRPALSAKASAYAAAILRSSAPERLVQLRKTLEKIRFTPSSREVVLALLKYGNLDDIKSVLGRIATEKNEIDFWNHTELGMTTARRLEKIGGGIPQFLNDILNKEEFWEYILPEERPNLGRKDLLQLKNRGNRALYVRLAAHAMIGVAEKQDQDQLIQLSSHNYSLIARAASIRLVRLLKEKALSLLSMRVDDIIQKGGATSLAAALRAAEIELYGVANLW